MDGRVGIATGRALLPEAIQNVGEAEFHRSRLRG